MASAACAPRAITTPTSEHDVLSGRDCCRRPPRLGTVRPTTVRKRMLIMHPGSMMHQRRRIRLGAVRSLSDAAATASDENHSALFDRLRPT